MGKTIELVESNHLDSVHFTRAADVGEICVHFVLTTNVQPLLLGLLKDGCELISQALTLFSSVCGVLHEDVCMCLRLLGRLSYISGEFADVSVHRNPFHDLVTNSLLMIPI